MKSLYLVAILFFIGANVQAQDCKVLVKSINKTYTGDCKKGKANGVGLAEGTDSYKGSFKKGYPEGEGVYTWSNGNYFEGTFKKGKKQGQGKLTYKLESGKDSIVNGFWNKDVYVGAYENPFKKIDNSNNVTGIRFKNIGDDLNSVRIYIREDNDVIRPPLMNIVVHHGLYQEIRNQNDFVELTNVTFPIKMRATYRSRVNKNEFMEIEIFQSGAWNVTMVIENIRGLEDKN